MIGLMLGLIFIALGTKIVWDGGPGIIFGYLISSIGGFLLGSNLLALAVS